VGTTLGVKLNSVNLASDQGPGGPAVASITVIGPPTLLKAFTPSTIALNGTSVLSFTVTNPNPTVSLTNVGFTDPLPTGVVIAAPLVLTGACGGGVIGATAGGNTITLAGATLAAGANCIFSVTVRGTTAGTIANTTSTVSSIEGGPGAAASATLTVSAGTAPVIGKTFGAASILTGASTSLTFTITNPNAFAALSGVGFSDALPPGLVVSTPNGLSGACDAGTIAAVAGGGTISLAAATLAGGGSCTFWVNVTGTTAGPKPNTTTNVISVEAGTGNVATANLTVIAPGATTISKTFGTSFVTVGRSTSLSFLITNPNASTALTGIAFSDTLPAGLVVATPNGLTGSCGAGTITAAAGGSTISRAGGTLAAGGSCTFTLNVTGTTPGLKTNTTTTVTSTEGGADGVTTASITVGEIPVPVFEEPRRVVGAGGVIEAILRRTPTPVPAAVAAAPAALPAILPPNTGDGGLGKHEHRNVFGAGLLALVVGAILTGVAGAIVKGRRTTWGRDA